MNKVFSLVVQEERQRNVTAQSSSGGVDTANSLAFATRADSIKRGVQHRDGQYKDTQQFLSNRNVNQKKERPLCTHCNIPGHIVEKCYKLHGCPPGYKTRPKAQTIATNQVSTQHNSDKQSAESGNVGTFF